MGKYDLGYWLITWMMLGMLGMKLVGGRYWTYIFIVSLVLFILLFSYLVFKKPKREKRDKNGRR